MTSAAARFNASHPQDPRHRPELRQRRLRAAEGADGDPRRLLSGHRLPVRVVGGQHRAQPHRRRPVLQDQAARRELERLLPGERSGDRRRRQGDRHPGARRQPRPGLQQEAVRPGRDPLPDGRLDVGRLPGRGQGLTDPDEAVRAGAYRSTAARTRSGTTTRCSGRPAATSSTPDNTKAAFNSPAGWRRHRCCSRWRSRTSRCTSTCRTRPATTTCSTRGKIGMLSSRGRGTCPASPDVDYGVQVLPGVPRRNHQTISGPDIGDVRQRRRPRPGGRDVPEVVHLPAQVMNWRGSTQTGHLPIRACAVTSPPVHQRSGRSTRACSTFVARTRRTSVKARPVIANYQRRLTGHGPRDRVGDARAEPRPGRARQGRLRGRTRPGRASDAGRAAPPLRRRLPGGWLVAGWAFILPAVIAGRLFGILIPIGWARSCRSRTAT